MYVGTVENGPYCDMPSPEKRRLRILLSPSLDSTQNDIACGIVELPPGSKSDWRAHKEGEMFFVISGKGKIRVGEEVIELNKYSAVFVPSNVPHQTYNSELSAEDLMLLFVLTPPFGGDKKIINRWKEVQDQLD